MGITVFIFDMSTPTAGQLVTVLSVTGAPPEVQSGLQGWKDPGFTAVIEDTSVDFVIDLSDTETVYALCPSPTSAICLAVAMALISQRKSVEVSISFNEIMNTWERVKAFITNSPPLTLRRLVIFPDMSVQL